MKKSKIIQLLPMLILIGGIFISSGCSKESCLPAFKQQLPAKMAEINFPFITEGVELTCTNSKETGAYMKYSGIRHRELQDKYEQKLKSEGWEFVREEDFSSSHFETTVLRDGKKITLTFATCNVGDKKEYFFSDCTSFGIKGL